MDELDLESEIYSLTERNKNLVNNQLLSDVCFLVGDEKVKIYGHQQTLALGSPVFYKMFYGDLKITEIEPIPIPDLTLNGFLNMIKHIYGHELNDLKLEEIYETYLAADKYLVYGLKKKLSNYIKIKSDKDNCCLIYDQLIKIQSFDIQDNDILPLYDVKNLIISNTESAFNSEHFLNITQNTLIELLKINELNIKEIDLLKSCLKWINMELVRNNLDLNLENRKMIFDKFRHLINYSKLVLEDINQFKDITHLFDCNEIGKLYLYLIGNSENNKMFNFDKNLRIMLSVYSTLCKDFNCKTEYIGELEIEIYTNRKISITSFDTINCVNISEFICFKNNQDLNLNYELEKCSTKNRFKLKDQLILDINNNYKFVFKYTWGNLQMGEKINFNNKDQLNLDKELRDSNGVIFNFNFKDFNFIHRIDYFILE